jgi:hypothetical protein
VYRSGKVFSYDLDHKQMKQKGSLRVENGEAKMEFNENGSVKTGSVKMTPTTIIGDQVEPWVREHWDELMKGDSIDVDYIALFRTSSYGFTFEKTRELDYHGTPAIAFELHPSSFIISTIVSLFVSKFEMIFEKDGQRRLLETRGTAFPHKDDKGSFSRFKATTVFKYL